MSEPVSIDDLKRLAARLNEVKTGHMGGIYNPPCGIWERDLRMYRIQHAEEHYKAALQKFVEQEDLPDGT